MRIKTYIRYFVFAIILLGGLIIFASVHSNVQAKQDDDCCPTAKPSHEYLLWESLSQLAGQ